MATRFLVPRANAEGGIGTSTKKWNEAHFVTGNFTNLTFGGTNVTSTAAELNILDGVTASTTELNYLDITTLGTSQASKALTADSSGDVKLAGNLQLNAQKELRFADADSSNYVGFEAPATVSSNKIWVLPAADGSTGQVLKTDGSGNLAWADNTSGSNIFQTIAVSGQSNVVADSATDTLTLVAGSNVTITTNASSDTITIAAAGGGGSGDITDVAAGTGLTGGGSSGAVSLNLGIQEFTEVQIAAGDKLLVLDADNSTHQLEKIEDIATLFAGTGLSASSTSISVGVDNSSIEISSDALRVKASGITNAMLAGSIADSKLNAISTAGKVALSALDIDGGTDIGGGLADADLIVVDDGADGTNRKAALSRIKTYVGAAAGAFSINNLDIDGGTDIGADLVDADLILVDDDAGGTNRKSALSRIKKYVYSAISGDAAASYTGALTISAGAIEHGMLAEDIISGQDELAHADIVDADELMISDSGTIKRVGVDSLRDHFFGSISGNATVADGGALTIAGATISGQTELSSRDDNNDLVLVYDVNATALKKMTLQTLLAGTGSSGDLSNVVEDTTPQLGGHLDVNSKNIVSISNGNISLLPHGTGKILLDGDGTTSNGGVSIENGLIDLKNGGTASKILFYCESSNAHAQTLQAAPHSAAASNTLVLPSAGSNLISDTATQTLTNKTLTNPTINAAALSGTLSGTPTFSGVGIHSAKDVFNAGLSVKNGSTSAGFVEFFEDSDNGANKATLIGPASTADVTLTLPAATGTLVGSGDSGTVTNAMLAGSITAAKLNNAIFADLETLGAPDSDGEFIVATGSGAFAYESANTARTSLGLGTGSSPTFTSLTLSAQAAAIAMNSQKITGLATPTADGDAATKAYVDGVAQGLSAKDSVRAATTANGTLGTAFANGQAIDGVPLATNDRILIKDQSTGSENGIYVVNASGAPTRAVDFDANAEVAKGAFVFVEEGTANADSGFVLTTDGSITLGSTALAFTQFSGAGQVTAGSALTKSGSTLNVAVDNSSIEVSSDALRVKASGITNAMLAQITASGKVTVGALDGVTSTAAELNILDGVTSTAAELNILDGVTATATELNYLDVTTLGTSENSKAVTQSSSGAIIVGATNGNQTIDIASHDLVDGGLKLGGTLVTASAAELNILDGVTATSTELNIMDGDTSATSTTLADADRVVVNDAGTMKQVALTDFETYFETSLDTLSSVTTVGALNAGSITNGFGAIDNGASNITTTGLISGGSLDIDNVLINGTTIGHTDDTDLITLANGIVTVAGEISVTTLDIGGTNVTSTAAELNILDGVTATATELNLLDGGTSASSSTTLVDADRIIVNDDGTMKQIALSDLKTYTGSGGSSTSISNGGEALAYDGSGNVDFDAVLLDIDASGAITIDGTSTLSIDSADTTNLTMTASAGSTKTLTISATNSNASYNSNIDIDADGTIDIDAAAGINIGKAADVNFDIDTAELDLDASAGITITSSEGAADSIVLQSTGSSGGIVFKAGTNDILKLTNNLAQIPSAARLHVDSTTDSTSISSGALVVDGGAGIAKNLNVGDDLSLLSDSAVLSLGAGSDATLTHDGSTGLTIAATPISIDSTGQLHLNSTTGDIKFQLDGTDHLALDLDSVSGEAIMKLMVDSDDFVFKQYDGTEVFRVEDDGSFDIAGGLGSSGVTISSTGAISAAGRIITDDTTNATSTTDGSLQTDGGLSVALDAVIGDDLKLLSDSAVLSLGAGSDATLTHDGTTGLTIAANPITLDSAAEINIDADSGVINLKDDGVIFGKLVNNSGDFELKSNSGTYKSLILNSDYSAGTISFRIQGNEKLGINNSGIATFSSDLIINGGDIKFGNSNHATLTIDSTAVGTQGKNLTITSGKPTAGTTNNISGGSLTLQGGQGKGTGSGGDIIFQVANAGSSGSSLNSYATALTISDDKSATFYGNVEVSSSTDSLPLVNIKNTNANANSAELRLTKDGSSVADNDIVGVVNFVSEDDANNSQTYGSIKSTIADASSGAEGGKLELFVAEHDGTITTAGLSLTDGDADGEIDVTIGAGSSSVTTVAGKISLGGIAYEFPTADGSANQVLKTDGSGNLDWTANSGSGGSQLPPEVKTESGTATLNLTPSNASTYNAIEVIYTCTGSSAYTVTLPTAASIEGKKIHVKSLATANITIDGHSSETIDGSPNFVLSTQNESVTLISDGTNWIII